MKLEAVIQEYEIEIEIRNIPPKQERGIGRVSISICVFAGLI